MEEPIYRKKALRIAITGPESTGKSILASQLARYFNEPWVPEYSREYLTQTDIIEYNFGDILSIAQGQYKRESELLEKADNYLFCDTDFLVSHIWSVVKYGRSHEWVIAMMESQPYDVTLLCNTDIPWEYDPLRENPHNRDHLFELYLNEINSRHLKYGVVEGLGAERFISALTILSQFGIEPKR